MSLLILRRLLDRAMSRLLSFLHCFEKILVGTFCVLLTDGGRFLCTGSGALGVSADETCLLFLPFLAKTWTSLLLTEPQKSCCRLQDCVLVAQLVKNLGVFLFVLCFWVGFFLFFVF